MGIPLMHPFWQNLHNIQFQAKDIFNIHNPPNLIQIIMIQKPTILMYINETLNHTQFLYTSIYLELT